MAGAERKRRYRQRQKRDLAVVPVEVHLPTLVDALMSEGYVKSNRDPTFSEVCAAATLFFADKLDSAGRVPR